MPIAPQLRAGEIDREAAHLVIHKDGLFAVVLDGETALLSRSVHARAAARAGLPANAAMIFCAAGFGTFPLRFAATSADWSDMRSQAVVAG